MVLGKTNFEYERKKSKIVMTEELFVIEKIF